MKRTKSRISPQVLREKFKEYKKSAILLAATYVVFIVIGLGAIYVFSYFQYRDDYCNQATALNWEFMNGNGIRTGSNLTTVFYTADGKPLLCNEAEDYTLDYESLGSTLKTPEGTSASNPYYTLKRFGPGLRMFAVVGIENSEANYLTQPIFVYYIWRINSLTIAWTTFIIAFSAIFFLGMVLILTYHLKEAELETMRRDYISNISHELKTPISSIKSLTEALADHLVDEEITRTRYYGIILSEAGRLERAVLNLLELNRLQSGLIRMEKKEISAEELFGPICERFAVRCDDIGIEFTAPDNLSSLPALYTNSGAITELTELLLDNAAKFTPVDGHIVLSIELQKFVRSVIVSVKDDGCGISEEELPHIFDRFYKGGEEHSGSGLGLAIGQEIAKRMGERLWVRSILGSGSVFTFTISIAHLGI